MKRLILMTALLCAAVIARGDAQTPARFPIAVMLTTTVDEVPFFYAQQQGMFEKAGLDVTATFVTSGSVASAAVVGGTAQIGASNIFTIIQAHSRGIPLVLIAPAGQHDPASPNSEVFVLRDSALKTPKDLEGQTLGVASVHDLQTLAVRALVERSGGDSAKVKFVELPQSVMLDALTSKRVDGIVAYEPFRTADEGSGLVRSLGVPYSAISKDMMWAGWVAMGPWVDQNHAVAVRFAQVIHQASLYTNPHFMELIPLMASIAKIQPDALRKLHRVRDATSLSPAYIQPVIDAAAHFKEIPAVFPAHDIVALGF